MRHSLKRPLGLLAVLTLSAVGVGAVFGTAAAQDYPNKAIKYVVPFAPGGITDYTGRLMATHLTQALGQSVVVENRTGAGGVTGLDSVVRSAPDGYTIVQMDPSIVINPTLMPSVPYDVFKQLAPVSIISSSPLVLVTAPQLPAKTFAEFVAYAKANPGKLNFSSAGIGTTPHLAGELFKQRTGVDAQHIPYKGIGQSYPDMMNNKIQFAFSSIAGALPFMTDKRVSSLATTGAKRSAILPDLPTVSEAGLAGYQVDLWLGIFVPAGVPQPIIAKLHEALVGVLKKGEVVAGLQKVGSEARGSTPAEGAALLKSEFDMWKDVIVKGNIKAE